MKKNDFYLIIGILIATAIVVIFSNIITRKDTASAVAVVTIDGSEYGGENPWMQREIQFRHIPRLL